MSQFDPKQSTSSLTSLSERAQSVMRSVVAQYMETGSTVSSRFISKLPGFELSSASIRSVMLDLEEAGLLYAPHTSAGRMPTEAGLRLFVEGLLIWSFTKELILNHINAICSELLHLLENLVGIL